MADGSQRGQEQRKRRHAFLPYLTSFLLMLLLAWFLVWVFYYRPTTREQLMVASFSHALDFMSRVYVDEVDQAELYQAAMKGMVQSLGDKHSAYLSPAQMGRLNVETKGEFGGIGVTVRQKNGLPLVVEVHEDCPAWRAGIQTGDFITHVDGEDINGLSFDKVIDVIRGNVGTDVELQLLRPAAEETFTVTLTREKISLPNVEWKMLADGIAWLRVASFDLDLAKRVEEALGELTDEGAQGLILDLRGNAGGVVDQAILVSDMFLTEGLIFSQKSRHPKLAKPVDASAPTGIDATVPVVVLVDEGTASSAEIVAGALQANGRATLVGANTVGKGAVSKVLELPDGSGLALIVSYYELAGGQIIEGDGLHPDVVVGRMPPYPEDGDPDKVDAWRELYAKGKEEQLQKAVEVLREKLGEQ